MNDLYIWILRGALKNAFDIESNAHAPGSTRGSKKCHHLDSNQGLQMHKKKWHNLDLGQASSNAYDVVFKYIDPGVSKMGNLGINSGIFQEIRRKTKK